MLAQHAPFFLRHLFGREHNDRDVLCFRASAESVDNLEAANLRHHQVQNDRVWNVFKGQFDALTATVGFQYPVTPSAERSRNPLDCVGLVVYYQHCGRLRGSSHADPTEHFQQLASVNRFDEKLHRAQT